MTFNCGYWPTNISSDSRLPERLHSDPTQGRVRIRQAIPRNPQFQRALSFFSRSNAPESTVTVAASSPVSNRVIACILTASLPRRFADGLERSCHRYAPPAAGACPEAGSFVLTLSLARTA